MALCTSTKVPAPIRWIRAPRDSWQTPGSVSTPTPYLGGCSPALFGGLLQVAGGQFLLGLGQEPLAGLLIRLGGHGQSSGVLSGYQVRRLQTANPVSDSVSVLWLLHRGIAALPKLVGLSRQWFLRVSFLGTVPPALPLCGSPVPADPAGTHAGSDFALPSAAGWRVHFRAKSSQC